MKKIKKGDPVIVIAGKHKGTTSSVERVVDDLVYLKEVNVVKKAKKGEGFVKKTLPLHISKIAYYLAEQKTPTKIGFEILSKDKKVRIAKKTGKRID